MLTAIIIEAREQPGTSKGITELILPHSSSSLKISSGPPSYPLCKRSPYFYLFSPLFIIFNIYKKYIYQNNKKKKTENKKEKGSKEATRGCGHVRCLQNASYKIRVFIKNKKKSILYKNNFLKKKIFLKYKSFLYIFLLSTLKVTKHF